MVIDFLSKPLPAKVLEKVAETGEAAQPSETG